MSGRDIEPEAKWLLDALGAAVLVIGAVAAGAVCGLVWLAIWGPV